MSLHTAYNCWCGKGPPGQVWHEAIEYEPGDGFREPPAVLLRDTPEDRERLYRAIHRGNRDVEPFAHGEADAIIAALRGEA